MSPAIVWNKLLIQPSLDAPGQVTSDGIESRLPAFVRDGIAVLNPGAGIIERGFNLTDEFTAIASDATQANRLDFRNCSRNNRQSGSEIFSDLQRIGING